jgi:riboflavin synthase
MFSGIIEALGRIEKIEKEETNVHFTVSSPFTHELKIDQSVAHNGACLTVVAISGDQYVVTAIQETILKTNLGTWQLGDKVNLERCIQLGDRIDGHMVQGHVDTTAQCIEVINHQGSWEYVFQYQAKDGFVTVPKGSITVNGVSLTVVQSEVDRFSVAIIPYTYEHTNFHTFQVGTTVNLEFDIIGKYVARYMSLKQG